MLTAEDVIHWLLDVPEWPIKFDNPEKANEEPYKRIISGGYANFDGVFLSKNWKTEWWQAQSGDNSANLTG